MWRLTAYTVTDELVLRAGAVKYSADKNDRVTYEEFLELTKASEQRYELIDGVVTPDLAIEVLSPSSRSKEMIPKLDLYRQCGVKEYWIVDPMKAQVTVYSSWTARSPM
ncbi:Uma2 family endonuclease [Paenibacillus sp. Dod16]|uniref:Uma2 family endonuclease n=1 Tax=Paenibacillus sp. Dod16 TaxID=3416392 RepID=UPI003CE80AEF